MANKHSKAKAAQLRKEKKHFHGRACDTSFWVVKGGIQIKNPNTNRRSPWKGGNASNKRSARQVTDLVAA
jgi:hypothetical protein